MSELDDIWAEMLAKAAEKARGNDRQDVAAYLDLKQSNDLLRTTGVKWIFDTVTEYSALANRSTAAITIEKTEPHNFTYRGANLVGTSVSFRYGVRCMTIEAGWTRTPSDGFMRGGGLAIARFRHFGMSKANVEMVLVNTTDYPVWRLVVEDRTGDEVDSEYLLGHIRLLGYG